MVSGVKTGGEKSHFPVPSTCNGITVDKVDACDRMLTETSLHFHLVRRTHQEAKMNEFVVLVHLAS
jgi:hypothetical protein